MKTEWTFLHVLGIPIRAHVTLLLFLPLLAILIAGQVPDLTELPLIDADAADVATALGGYGDMAAGIVIAVGLFASVLLHELGHAAEARRHDLDVSAITLWIFGGIAHLKGMPKQPKAEALVAIAGPIVSFGLGAIGLGLRPVVGTAWLGFIVGYLGLLNVVLGAFNLIPAFPLDGGRLFRAGLAMRRPYLEATKTASDVGKGIAILMGLAGLFINIWLILIAFFVYIAASQEVAGVELTTALDPIAVSTVMDTEPPTVDADMHVDELTQRMLSAKTTGFPVVNGHEGVVGVITLSDVRDIEVDQRAVTRVGDVMSTELIVIDPYTSAARALRTMQEEDVGRLLVVGPDGSLMGVVTRESIMRAFEIARTQPSQW